MFRFVTSLRNGQHLLQFQTRLESTSSGIIVTHMNNMLTIPSAFSLWELLVTPSHARALSVTATFLRLLIRWRCQLPKSDGGQDGLWLLLLALQHPLRHLGVELGHPDEHLGERRVVLVLADHVLVQYVPHELELGGLLQEMPADDITGTYGYEWWKGFNF